MLNLKNILAGICIMFTILFLNHSIKAQEIPTDGNQPDRPVVDSIDQEENLLDSNQAYKEKFDSLSKDGEWVTSPKSEFIRDLTENTGESFDDVDFGSDEVVYVWRPYSVYAGWNPYCNGNWVFTNFGWVWSSYYSWGWGPYNYGRWYCSNYYGWVWLPGCAWSPNWVTWQCSNQYVGWYPTCPVVQWRGGINVYTNHLYAYQPHNWVFVDKKNFTKKIDNTTVIAATNNVKILKTTQKTKAITYSDPSIPQFKYKGPDANLVASASGERIDPKKVVTTESGGKVVTNENANQNTKAVRNTGHEGNSNSNTNGTINNNNSKNNNTKNSNTKNSKSPPKNEASKNNTQTKSTNQTKQNKTVKSTRSTNTNKTNSHGSRKSRRFSQGETESPPVSSDEGTNNGGNNNSNSNTKTETVTTQPETKTEVKDNDDDKNNVKDTNKDSGGGTR